MVRLQSWPTALYLAAHDYPVSWLDPVTAAWLGEAIEIVCPPLLAFGLATRFAGLPMLILSLVIQFAFQALDQHLFWAMARVILMQAGPRILPTFPESLSRRATAALPALGVEVLTDSRVERIDEEGIVVAGRRVAARNAFWATGVMASPAAQWLKAEADRGRRQSPISAGCGSPVLSPGGSGASSTSCSCQGCVTEW